MTGGIRATVSFNDLSVCPLARLSATADTVITAVSTSVSTDESTCAVSDVVVDLGKETVPDDMDHIFSYGEAGLVRMYHDAGVQCPCECLGQFGCPVERYVARRGSLTLVFHAADYTQLQHVVGDLRDRFPTIDIVRMIRSPDKRTQQEPVFVDLGGVTDRQLEVLYTAFQMGYFERPRRANATEIAAALDITPSTFAEHLAAAQSKLFTDLLEDTS